MSPFAFRSSGKDGRRIGLLVALLLGVGVVCVTVAGFGVPGKAIYQGVFVLCLMAAAYLWVRFLLTAYCYECREEEGETYLYIIKVTGRRMQTLACLSLQRVREIRRYPAGQKPDKREGSLLSFTTAIFSDTEVLSVDIDGKPQLVRLEAEDAFFIPLREAWRLARAGRGYDPAEAEHRRKNSKEEISGEE